MSIILRKDLIPPASLINEFTEIRNILAGNQKGMTLDQVLVNQLINLLLCKMYDEKNTKSNEPVKVQVIENETNNKLFDRIESIFEHIKLDINLNGLLLKNEKLEITPSVLEKVIKILEKYEITNSKRDIIGEAFELFIGPSLRGNSGQFFTPRNVGEMMCEVLNPKDNEVILDPACGTGGFLTEVIKYTKNLNNKVYGIDRDNFLARVSGMQLSLLDDGNTNRVFCNDSLEMYNKWPLDLNSIIKKDSIDVIITNPPFGNKIDVSEEIVKNYELGHDWKKDSRKKEWVMQEKVSKNRPPQVLFIERCLDLLKPGGRMGIVLPDGILGNQKEAYIRQFILSKADIVGIIDLPLETFLPSTSTKTSVIFMRKKDGINTQENIFMAIPKKCGHDRRGNVIYREDGSYDDDLPIIAAEFKKWSVDNARDF